MRRVQLFSAIEQLEEMGFTVIDIITLGGIVRPLAEAAQTFDRSVLIREYQHSAQVSKENGAEATVTIAHADCKGHPVPEEKGRIHLRYAEQTIHSFKLGIPNLLFWQKEDNSLEQL